MTPTASQSVTLRGLMRLILEDPASDMSRLVYADFLEESGIDPDRAEFIRVQVELHHTVCHQPEDGEEIRPRTAYTAYCNDTLCRHCSLDHAANELSEGHWVAWSQPLGPHILDDVPEFRRGFVAEVRCTANAWLAHGPAVCARQPVERIVLTDKEPGTPHQLGRWGRTDYWWEPGIGFEAPHQIPFCFGEAAKWEASFFGLLMLYQFPAREEAIESLSTAALRWALAEAGVTRGGGENHERPTDRTL